MRIILNFNLLEYNEIGILMIDCGSHKRDIILHKNDQILFHRLERTLFNAGMRNTQLTSFF
jgi:hypothetical protein